MYAGTINSRITITMRKADFFIVGFMKSGTTALASFLDQHPRVFMSVPKEPAYFATDLMAESDRFHGKPLYFKTRTKAEYEALFARAAADQILGDASTAYIYSQEAAKNIHAYNPDAKIIILIRNPVDFVHALHRQYLNETVEEETDFQRALELEQQRSKGDHIPTRVRVPSYLFYSQRMKYFEQVQRYSRSFPSEQLLIMLHDEFRADNAASYRRVLDFLELPDDGFSARFGEVHGSREPRSPWLNKVINHPPLKNIFYRMLGGRLYTRLHKSIAPLLMRSATRDPIPAAARQQLMGMSYREVERLGELIDKDLLSLWGYDDSHAA